MAPAAERSVRRHRAWAEHARTRRAIAVGASADVQLSDAAGRTPADATGDTDGEFHTIRRQLDRLAEEGVHVVKVAAQPVETLAERLGGDASTRRRPA